MVSLPSSLAPLYHLNTVPFHFWSRENWRMEQEDLRMKVQKKLCVEKQALEGEEVEEMV